MSKQSNPLSENLLEDLPLIYRFPTSRYNTYSNPTSLINSTFYQSKKSICFPSVKPISKIISFNENLS